MIKLWGKDKDFFLIYNKKTIFFMKKIFFFLTLCFPICMWAQTTEELMLKDTMIIPYKGTILAKPNGIFGEYPNNILTGKCYKKIRYWCGNNCGVPISEQVLTKSAVTKTQITKAKKEIIEENIVVRPSVSLLVTQEMLAKLANKDTVALEKLYFEQKPKIIVLEEADTITTVVAGSEKIEEVKVVLSPETTRFIDYKIKGCKPTTANYDCLVRKLEVIPEVSNMIKKTLVMPEVVKKIIVPQKTITLYLLTVKPNLKDEGTIRISLPARYKSIKKTVKISREIKEVVSLPAEYSTVSLRKLDKKDGCCAWLERWFEVSCEDFKLEATGQ